MANVRALCFNTALLALVAFVVADLPEEECDASELLQHEVRLHDKIVEIHAEAANNLAAGSKILIIGDSNAAFAGPYQGVTLKNTLQDACAGSTVINKGDPGTKVSAWMAHGLLANAVNSQTGWTHVWLSIGGNDLAEDHGCGPNGSKKNAIKADITKLIAEIKKLTTAKIVLTGYAVSAADDTCSLTAVRENVDKAMKEIATADPAVTYASTATGSGGIFDPAKRASQKCDESVMTAASASPKIGIPPCRGDKQFFMSDFIHLNAKGYAATWALPDVQKAFGCHSGKTPGPSPGPNPLKPTKPRATCIDNDAAVGPASDSAFNTCAELMASPYKCDHPQYGARIKAMCPASCKCSAPSCCK